MVRVAAFGEVMLRLNPDLYLRLEQSNSLNMSYTGTGLNILAGMNQNGIYTRLISVIPENRIGETCLTEINKLGVNTNNILLSGNHMGIYFLELGHGIRPSEVTYLNRKNSSFNEYVWSDDEIAKSLDAVDVLHFCGIALSTSLISHNNVLKFATIAKSKGIKICFDFNYRPSLNNEVDLKSLIKSYQKILKLSDIVVGSKRDIDKIYENETTIEKFIEDYDISLFLGTQKTFVENRVSLKGFIFKNREFIYSKEVEILTLDRIGTGDAFVSGFLAQYLKGEDCQYALDYGVLYAQLAHTTMNDYPILSEKFVKRVMTDMSDVFR